MIKNGKTTNQRTLQQRREEANKFGLNLFDSKEKRGGWVPRERWGDGCYRDRQRESQRERKRETERERETDTELERGGDRKTDRWRQGDEAEERIFQLFSDLHPFW